MIKNSIELAQILSTICTEQYTSIYYKLVEKIYSCLKSQNFLFIYVSAERYGIALDFQTKLCKGQKTLKNTQIIICQVPFEFETQVHPEDTLLLLDKNDEILEIARKINVNILNLSEHELELEFSYVIPTKNYNRASETQKVLLNDISENCLKFLP